MEGTLIRVECKDRESALAKLGEAQNLVTELTTVIRSLSSSITFREISAPDVEEPEQK